MRKALRILQFVAVFMVYLVITMTVAFAVSFSHDPSDSAVDGIGVAVDGNSATIRWSTDEDATAGLRYGAASPPTETVMGTDVGQEHEVALSGLEYDTEYFYSLIALIDGAEEVDDNGGSYYRFTTGPNPLLDSEAESEGEGESSPDYTPPGLTAESDAAPFISAIIPRYVHTRSVSIAGRTAARATVRIYVNVDESSVGGISYNLVTTSNDEGEFSFPRVPLPQEDNVLYLWARSLSGEEGQVRYEVTVDNEGPVVDGDLPDVSNSTTLRYTGTVSEDVTINVTVGDNSDASAHSAGQFDVEIPLEDMALQEVTVTFTDSAGNMVVKRSTIFASTQDPVIYRTNLASINPSYVRDVTITGNVTPRSYVVVFVNGETSPDGSWPTSVQEIIRNFGTIISGDQYGTYTEDGLFRIPILLSQQATTQRRIVTAGVGGVTGASQLESELARERGYPTSFGGYGSTRADLAGEYDNQIEVLVISRTGRTSSSGPQAVKYTKCGFGGDYAIDISQVTPTIIIPEHLRRGIAHLGFTVTLQWQGAGRETQRASTSIRPYRLSEEERQEYAIDPEDLISPSSQIIPRVSNDGKTISVLMLLNRINYTQADLDDLNLEDLRIKIPLMIELNYMTETQPNCVPGQGISCIQNRVQRECFDINTALDIQIPAGVIPEDLLMWSVSALNDTINIIDRILEPLQIITQVTFYVCLASWIVLFITKVYEQYTCVTNSEDSDECRSAEKTTRDVDYGMRWICDRVFCPAAPNFAKWANDQVAGTGPKGITEGVNEEGDSTQILCKGVISGSGPSSPPSTSGAGLFTSGSGTGQMGVSVNAEFYNQPASWENFPIVTCADEYVHQWETSCLLMDELKESRCQKARATEDEENQRKFCGNFIEQGFSAVTSMCKANEVTEFEAVSPVDRNRYQFRRPSWFARPEASEIERETRIPGRTPERAVIREQERRYTRPLDSEEVQRLQLSVRQRDDYVIDPTADILSALRCVCLPAIQGYLQLWRNILEAIKQCFQTVLVGGDASSGMCRAVLTTYLCDFVFSAISCFVNAFGIGSGDSASGESERGIGAFFQALRGAGSDIQSSVQSRYGASNLYRTMFTERRLVNSICLFAFTGDWDLDLDMALGGVGSIPLRSEGLIYPATRRFISSDPNSQGRATQIYHIGAGLVAGDNINFRLELVCSANTLCNPDDGFIGGECDCFQSNREQVYDITRELGGGRLSAGDILGVNEGNIYVLVQNAPVRYDKVRMRWQSQRRSAGATTSFGSSAGQPLGQTTGRGGSQQNQYVTEGPLDGFVEQPITQVGGSPPTDCGYNVGLGEYRCSFNVGARGYAMFRTEPQSVKARINAQGQIIPGTSAAPFVLGEKMDLNFEVAKQSPNYDPRSATRNVANEIPFFLTYRVKRGSRYIPITNSPEPGQGTDVGLVRIARDGIMAFPRDANVPGLVVSPAMFSVVGMSSGITTRTYPISGGGSRTLLQATPNTAGAAEQRTEFYVRFVQDGSNVRYEMGSVSNYRSQGSESTMNPPGPARVTGIVSRLGVQLDGNYRGIFITPRQSGTQRTVNDLLNKAAVYLYQRPGTTSAAGCNSQDPVTFTIEMELKYATTRERVDRSAPTEEDITQGRVRITPLNAVPSSEVVRDPAGQLQRKTVQVQAICRDRPAVNPCIANRLVGAECECGSGSTAQSCSPTDANINYCMEYRGVYSCIPYNECLQGERNARSVASGDHQTLTQDLCDCDGDPQQRMECERGASCNEDLTDDNWVCSTPRTFARASTYEAPTSSTQIPGTAPALLGNFIFHGVTHQEQREHGSNVNIIRAAQSVISLSATAQADKNQQTSAWAQSKDMEVAINGDISCPSGRVPLGIAASGGRAWVDTCGDDASGGVGVDSGGRITILTPLRMASAAPSMRELVSGQPLLVDGGVVQPFMEYCASNPGICEQSPRTAVGLTADGTFLMVTVDGGSSTSQGMTITELAEYMVSLDAVRALNLDGRGSSTMYIEGRGVVNRPSDGRERIVINHLGINARDLGYAPAPATSRTPGTGTAAGSVILFGHSLVESDTAPLVVALRNELGMPITAAGRRGWTIPRWLRAGDAAEVVRGYSIVFVVLNNQRARINSADIVRLDLELKTGGATVVWIGDSPRPAGNPYDGTEVYQWEALLAAKNQGVTHVLAEDWPMPTSGYSAVGSRDNGLHVMPSGARLWATRLEPLLRPYLPVAPVMPTATSSTMPFGTFVSQTGTAVHLPVVSVTAAGTTSGGSSVNDFRFTSCDGLADSSVPFKAYFTSYHKPSYGSPDGYSAPYPIISGSGRSHVRSENQLTGNAPGTDAQWAFFCAAAMQGSCPTGTDRTKRCYAGRGRWSYGGSDSGWSPCNPFPRSQPYGGTDSPRRGRQVIPGRTVAADSYCFKTNVGCMISIDGGAPRQITDTGSGIRGRRFDAYSTEARGPGSGRVSGVHMVQVLNPERCYQRAAYRGGAR